MQLQERNIDRATTPDVGCGVGEVTCLVAEIVGSEGAVVGVDFAGTVLSTARSRATSRGLSWARFVEADIASVSLSDLSSQPFDAVVGRLVLMGLGSGRRQLVHADRLPPTRRF